MPGRIHIYCGDGKGKTTAAVGLAVRASGAGKNVLFVQFSKDGSSSEMGVLASLPGIETAYCPIHYGFYKNMDAETRALARGDYTALLEKALEMADAGVELLVLDEAVSACNHGMISLERLCTFLREKPDALEVVLTGRNPPEELLALADYVTEMKKLRHPFDRGIGARRGIEF